MHRTQILLKEAQYESLLRLSRQTGKSLSELIRDWVQEKLEAIRPSKKDGLLEFIGSGKSKKPLSGRELENLDPLIYGPIEKEIP